MARRAPVSRGAPPAVARGPVKGSGAALNRAGLKIAGFHLLFESGPGALLRILARRYAGFTAGGRAAFRFRAAEAAGRESPFKPAVDLRDGRLGLARGDFKAALDLRTGRGELLAAPNEQCLDAFLRSLISALLIRSGGFMLHSAGLLKNGKAYLFLGRSGAGKSTLSRLAASAGAEVISDELNLLRPVKNGFRAYGSPFWGEMRSDGRQGSWPLGGVFLLKKAEKNGVAACSKPEALRLLLRCLVNFSASPAAGAAIMANSARLMGTAKFSRLCFRKDGPGFLELI